jgi:biopolymer transport protein ExbD
MSGAAAPENMVESTLSPDDELMLMRRRHKGMKSPVEGLNLTAMMDMMTIILVFLIKQYASAPENITLNDDLRPPASSSTDNLVPSTQVLISKTAVMVADKPVLKIDSDGKVSAVDGSAEPWTSVQAALEKRVATINAIHERGGAEFDGNLMVVADEDTPYDVVSKVLYQAGKAQFTTYRLVVRRK